MINKIMSVLLVALMVVVTGCSRETVPPAAKGKILSGAGYSADLKEPGKYWVAWWNNLVVLDTSTQAMTEPVTVKMKDNLDLKFDVRFRTRIEGNEKVINSMFNDIRHKDYQVTLPMVYNIYGRDVVRSVSRSVVGKYDTADVPQNFDIITQQLYDTLSERLKDSPLELSNITLANIEYPKVITEAIEAQHERRLAIETEQNQQAIEMVKKENELRLAEAEYEIRVTRAKAVRDENKITAEGLNPVLIQYRQLEVMEQMARNKNAVFVPYESLSNVGLQNRMYNK